MAKPTLKAVSTAKGSKAKSAVCTTVKSVWADVRAGKKDVILSVETNTANSLMEKRSKSVDVTYKGLHKMQSGKTLFRVAFDGKQSPSLYSMCGYKNPDTKQFGLRFKSTGIRV